MAEAPRPGESFGRYQVLRRIGHGGMGSVYEARQDDLARSVALKVLLPNLSQEAEFRHRFVREARTLAAMDSPHVIQVYDHGEHDGQLFIATQLVSGGDLQEHITARGPIPIVLALELAAQVASGLGDAHAAGLLHRDVKPSNVLLRESQGAFHVYLCDFGIARGQDDDLTATGAVAGTLGYMAPERHQGMAASPASDLYSLGCVLWAMLVGRAPYADTSGVQLAMAHMQRPVPQFSGDLPEVAAVNRVLARAMAKRPEERHGSAQEMRADLLAAAETVRNASGSRPDLEATLLRAAPAVPAIASTAPVSSTPMGTPSAKDGRRGRAWIPAAVAAALIVAGVSSAGYLLAGDDGEKSPTATGAGETTTQERVDLESPTPDVGTTPTPEATPADRGRKKAAGTRETEKTSSAEPTPTSEPSPTAAPPETTSPPAAAVTCWDGQARSSREACSVPVGASGLATVFPSMSGCSATSFTVAGKAEVFECTYSGFLIRYTRWVSGFDRYAYLDSANGVPGAEWWVDGEFAGRQWTSFEDSSSESEPYQWSASYRYQPYSVSVEGVSKSARAEGMAMLRVRKPSEVRLR